MSRGLIYPDDRSAMLPEALPALADVRSRGLAHRYVRHVRSSQAFALNLFAPLSQAGVKQVFAALGHSVHTAEPPIFEFEDPQDRLQEASKRSPHRTQVDVLLRALTEDGTRVAALIEVKFGESNFGPCSAFASPDNPSLHVCHQPGLFGSEPDRCFQLLNHGRGRRRYDDYLADLQLQQPSRVADDSGCLVRLGRSQPMRNLALAHLLAQENDFDRIVFAVCAPEAHPTIWRRFGEFVEVFPDTDRVRTLSLLAEVVAREQPDRGAAFFARYRPAMTGAAGTTALLHMSPDGRTLFGIWANDGGIVEGFYGAGQDEGADAYGEEVIARREWVDAFDSLPRTSPYVAWWEPFFIGAGETLQDAYRRAQTERF